MDTVDSRWYHMRPDGSRCFRMSPDGFRWLPWLQKAPDASRYVQIARDSSRWLQMTPDGFRWFQKAPEAPDRSRYLQVAPDDSRWLQMTPDVSRWLQKLRWPQKPPVRQFMKGKNWTPNEFERSLLNMRLWLHNLPYEQSSNCHHWSCWPSVRCETGNTNQESIQIVKANIHWCFHRKSPNETEPSQGKSNRIDPQRPDSNQIDQHWKSLDPNNWNCIDPSLVASNQSKPPHIESDHIESHQTEMNPLHLHEHKWNQSPPRQIESNHYRAKYNHWITWRWTGQHGNKQIKPRSNHIEPPQNKSKQITWNDIESNRNALNHA